MLINEDIRLEDLEMSIVDDYPMDDEYIIPEDKQYTQSELVSMIVEWIMENYQV